MRYIGGLSSPVFSRALDINDSGQVSGFSGTLGSSLYHAFRWSEDEGMIDLGTLYGGQSWSSAIDSNGHVFGISVTETRQQSLFEWSPSAGMVDLGPIEPQGDVSAVNDSGQIVGRYFYGPNVYHAFIWDQTDGMRDLPISGWSQATDINCFGQVVGTYSSSEATYGFLWDPLNGMRTIGEFEPQGINYLGQVVGYRYVEGGVNRACIWQECSGLVDLPMLVDGYSWAYDINNQGQIVGQSSTASGVTHAILWTPVPEPCSLAALCVGMAALMLKRRK
jgi:probable HAF family extracellular repeat protein